MNVVQSFSPCTVSFCGAISDVSYCRRGGTYCKGGEGMLPFAAREVMLLYGAREGMLLYAEGWRACEGRQADRPVREGKGWRAWRRVRQKSQGHTNFACISFSDSVASFHFSFHPSFNLLQFSQNAKQFSAFFHLFFSVNKKICFYFVKQFKLQKFFAEQKKNWWTFRKSKIHFFIQIINSVRFSQLKLKETKKKEK